MLAVFGAPEFPLELLQIPPRQPDTVELHQAGHVSHVPGCLQRLDGGQPAVDPHAVAHAFREHADRALQPRGDRVDRRTALL
eukprot:1110780-Prymnesium_polylepis.1